jgi:hypothetical protein
MNGGSALMVAILSGIGLSTVYIVEEYRRWIKHEAAKRDRSEMFQRLLQGAIRNGLRRPGP